MSCFFKSHYFEIALFAEVHEAFVLVEKNDEI